jgi:D-alanyl-lipoteichoic acid acyltransferase DltB (MBOAT superfamily)
MSLNNILIALGISLVIGLVFRGRGRVYAMAAVSVAALYWLQPSLRIRGYEIWLPSLVMGIIVLSWGLVSGPEELARRENWVSGLALVGLVAGLELVSRLDVDWAWFNPSPLLFWPTISLALALLLTWRLSRSARLNLAGVWLMIGLLITLFVLIKLPVFSEFFSWFLHKASVRLPGPQVPISPRFDLRWFGFSYIAFRLIHTLRDRQMRRLPQVSLAEYVTYVVFFPALAAGPIDRIERFVKELRQPLALDSAGWLEAGQRLMVGLFKKFVLADSLVTFALSGTNADDLRTTGWMWFYLYAYTLLIYFDFSGYTDIAIGLGRLLGLKMPENFNAPYLKSNLTQFWNNWHMTLTQWFRAYFFNPLTRSLRSSGKVSVPAVIFITQIATMLLIGLWHGITWNFVLWGLWHGLGLFLQNRWSDFIRPRAAGRLTTPGRQKTVEWLGVFATFNFVALGWVFFVLPTPGLARQVFLNLFGLA